MLNQHWVGIMLYRFVRLFAVARFSQDSVPMLVVCALVIAAGVANYAPSYDADATAFEDLPELAEPSQQAASGSGAAAGAGAIGHHGAAMAARGMPSLNHEQQNIARFIARRYQVALEQTQEFVEYAYRTARDAKLDPWLILAVISVESSFDPAAQSNRGAQGLMQVLTRVHADKFAPFGGVTAAFDPLANMRVGAQILKSYLTRDGSVEGALKSYAGAALLPHDGGYGAKVLTERERIAIAASGGRPELVDKVQAPAARSVAAPVKPAQAPLRDVPVAQESPAAAAASASQSAGTVSGLPLEVEIARRDARAQEPAQGGLVQREL